MYTNERMHYDQGSRPKVKGERGEQIVKRLFVASRHLANSFAQSSQEQGSRKEGPPIQPFYLDGSRRTASAAKGAEGEGRGDDGRENSISEPESTSKNLPEAPAVHPLFRRLFSFLVAGCSIPPDTTERSVERGRASFFPFFLSIGVRTCTSRGE